LHGVVNNAGVMTVGALHEIPEQDLTFQFDVNVYGVYRVTKAFVPLIAESQGRIVNIGSVTGIFSEPVTGAYHMSKQAIEAYTDSLAASLASLGIDVSVIEPGRFQSNIMNSMAQRMAARENDGETTVQTSPGQLLLPNGAGKQIKKPDAVADAVLHALFDDNPKRRYLVVPDQATAERTIRDHLEKLVQLNAEHAFSFDRDTLVEMLDEALADQVD
jgi:NAD(P)-dependent dehydrogenase (short-subunit alcohol dehydrogenase family)